MSFNIANPAKPTIDKDPDAVLDYSFDWSAWMCGDDTIVTLACIPTGTLVVDSFLFVSVLGDPAALPDPVLPSHVTTSVISGGTPGQTEQVTHRITTSQGRIDDRTMFFKVKER